MAKDIKFSEEARRAMLRGVDALANAVKVTLVLKAVTWYREEIRSPLITKDGVTVAKEIELEDAFENMGAQLVKEVARKQMTMLVTVQQLQQFLLKLSTVKVLRS